MRQLKSDKYWTDWNNNNKIIQRECRMTSQKMGHHVTDMQPLMWLWCHLIWPFLCKKGENLSNISSWNSHYCVCFLSTKFSFMKVQTCLNLGSEWCHHFLKTWVINQKVLYVKTNLNLCTLSDIKDFSISYHITKKRGGPKLRRTCGHPVFIQ